MIAALMVWASAEPPALAPVDGTLLPIGDQCSAVTTGAGAPAGSVLRRIERLDGGRLRLTIVSRFNGGPLLTSRIEVASPSLRPFRTIEQSDGKTTLAVRYRDAEARGTLTSDDGRHKSATAPLAGPVWDEETAEFVVAALPLAAGATFDVPIFHFGRGPGVMHLSVRRSVAFGEGRAAPVDAWEVEGSTRSDMTTTYVVEKATRRLLAIEVGGVRSLDGGNCSGLMG